MASQMPHMPEQTGAGMRCKRCKIEWKIGYPTPSSPCIDDRRARILEEPLPNAKSESALTKYVVVMTIMSPNNGSPRGVTSVIVDDEQAAAELLLRFQKETGGLAFYAPTRSSPSGHVPRGA